MTSPLVSVIVVDYKRDNPYLKENLSHLAKQSYRHFELILLTDYPITTIIPKNLKYKHHIYGRYVGPAAKRDHGAKLAKGTILAFLDDDAHPSPDWLKHLVAQFKGKDITAVAGPGVTPKSVSTLETASGWISASPMGSGLYIYRFLPHSPRFVDDFPSMNLAVRKKDFLAVGGFDSHYYPGEDTKLCLDLTHKLGKKILYHPSVLVYHHRRPLWLPHLKQNGNYGLHRGFFARILPRTSLRHIYFGPSLLLLGLLYLLTPLHLISPFLTSLGWSLFTVYLGLLFLNTLWIYYHSKSFLQAQLALVGVFLTHLWYGVKFLHGLLFTRRLQR